MLKKLKSIDIFKILPHAKSPVKSNLIFRNFLYGKIDDTNSYQINKRHLYFHIFPLKLQVFDHHIRIRKNKTSGLALKIRILPFEKLLRIPVTRVQKVREFLGGLLFLAEGQLRE